MNLILMLMQQLVHQCFAILYWFLCYARFKGWYVFKFMVTMNMYSEFKYKFGFSSVQDLMSFMKVI